MPRSPVQVTLSITLAHLMLDSGNMAADNAGGMLTSLKAMPTVVDTVFYMHVDRILKKKQPARNRGGHTSTCLARLFFVSDDKLRLLSVTIQPSYRCMCAGSRRYRQTQVY